MIKDTLSLQVFKLLNVTAFAVLVGFGYSVSSF